MDKLKNGIIIYKSCILVAYIIFNVSSIEKMYEDLRMLVSYAKT